MTVFLSMSIHQGLYFRWTEAILQSFEDAGWGGGGMEERRVVVVGSAGEEGISLPGSATPPARVNHHDDVAVTVLGGDDTCLQQTMILRPALQA